MPPNTATINSPATQAVVGFANGRTCRLDHATIRPSGRYAAIYLTAQGRQGTIASSQRLLIVAIARARNTGMKILRDSRLLDRGTPPIVMEPVRARISIQRSGTPTVHVLDHDGRRTGRTLSVSNGSFDIDGSRDQTCYYLVEY